MLLLPFSGRLPLSWFTGDAVAGKSGVPIPMGLIIAFVFLYLTAAKADDDEVYALCEAEGQSGYCVPYFMCHPENNTIITDGAGIIDMRSMNCGSFLEVCCYPGSVAADKQRASLDFNIAVKEHSMGQELSALSMDTQDDWIRQAFAPPSKCGISNPGGVGVSITGQTDGETQPGEFPWTVLLLRNVTNAVIGGGSIIHPSVVLTAAHKVAKNWQSIIVRAGEWDSQSTTESYEHEDRNIMEVVTHPRFTNTRNYHYDVSLLILSEPLIFAVHIAPVCLPQPRQVYPGIMCVVAGWGKKSDKDKKYPNLMKKVDVPLVEHDECQKRLRESRPGPYYVLDQSLICAGGEVGKDACKGDGGGPLVCPTANEDNQYMQLGIVVAGIKCGTTVPSLYANVNTVKPWIDQTMIARGYGVDSYTANTSETQTSAN